MRRGRLRTAFSKNIENHAAAFALHTSYYNFVRIHQTLKVTRAMAAGVSQKLWEVSDTVEMLEQWELANFKPEYQFVVRKYAIGKGSFGKTVLKLNLRILARKNTAIRPAKCNP